MSKRIEIAAESRILLNPSGSRVLVVSGPLQRCELRDAVAGTILGKMELFDGPDAVLLDAHFLPDGELVQIFAGKVQLWNPATGKVDELVLPDAPRGQRAWRMEDAISNASSTSLAGGLAAVDLGHKLLAVSAILDKAQLYDLATRRPLHGPLSHGDRILHVAFNADGSRLVTASMDRTARVWDTRTGRAVTPSLQHDTAVVNAVFDATGRLLATAAQDGSARVWDSATGEALSPPLFAADRLALASLVDHDAGFKLVPQFMKHILKQARAGAEPVRSIAFSPSGDRLFVLTGSTEAGPAFDADRSANKVFAWDLSGDARPLQELMHVARLVAGQHVDAAGTLVETGPEAWVRAWHTFTEKHPEFAALPAATLREWQRREALLCSELNDRPGMRYHLNQLLRADPGEIDFYQKIGLGDWSEVQADMTKLLEAHPDLVPALELRVTASAARADWKQALADSTRLISLRPADMNHVLSRGEAYLQNGEYARALEDAQRVLDSGSQQSQGHRLRGHVHMKMKLYAPAVADFTAALKLSPDAALWVERGVAHGLDLRWDDAVKDFSRAIELGPHVAMYRNKRGWACLGQCRWSEAALDFSEAINISAYDRDAWISRATAHYHLGKWDLALADADKAIKLEPKSTAAHINRGLILTKMRKFDEAVAAHEQAVAGEPKSAAAHHNLADLFKSLGRLMDALAAYEKAVAADAQLTNARTNLETCKRLLVLEPRLPAFLEGTAKPADARERLDLAELCACKKMYRNAFDFYAAALAGQPDLARSHGYKAAACATQAASGAAKEAIRARQLALTWLQGELAFRKTQLESPRDRADALKALQWWRVETDLAAVRGSDVLAQLPGPERDPWRQFWADVDASLAAP